MSKSAMQELIERVKEYQEEVLALLNQNENLKISANAITTATDAVIMQAQGLLEKEKQQIIDAKNDKLYPIEIGGLQYYKENYAE